MNKFNKLLFVFFLLFTTTQCFTQSIKNVSFRQSEQQIIISYTVSGLKFDQHLTTSMYVSTDGGSTFTGPLKEVTGDVGENVTSGNKEIVWDVYKEIPSFGGDIVFDVRAELIKEKQKKAIAIGYSGSYFTPAGLMFGVLGKTGFYVSGKINPIPQIFTTSDFEGNDNGITNFNETGYYEYDNERVKQRLAITGGVTFQAARNFFLYAGGGYGYYNLLWHINNLDYSGNPLSDAYVKHTERSITGIEAEAGFIVRFNKIYISAGALSLQFKTIDVAFGIGVSF